MKITGKDMEEVMDAIKRKPTEDILKMTVDLNTQLVQTAGYQELVQQVALTILANSFGQKPDLSALLSRCAGVAALAGALIGFRLGLREAGLELGITPTRQRRLQIIHLTTQVFIVNISTSRAGLWFVTTYGSDSYRSTGNVGRLLLQVPTIRCQSSRHRPCQQRRRGGKSQNLYCLVPPPHQTRNPQR